jgi:pyridinium-3,5-biscarboxylic acid mononucleotide sulfurtransferase
VATDVGDPRSKLVELRAILHSIAEPVVAFSGGVDSSFLALVARQEVGERLRAVIADSPSLPRRELREALGLARKHDISLEVVATDELHDDRYRANGADRCASCKEALVGAVVAHPALGSGTLLLGVNVDDLRDHRPGQAAAARRGARFPLVEAGLGKHEVRTLARELDLETWDKPAAACLASRLAYGVPVTATALRRVERAEDALRDLGFAGAVRVRDQGGDLARIEVPADRLADLVHGRERVVTALHDAGFRYVTLDLEGFRSGSQNLVLTVGRSRPA